MTRRAESSLFAQFIDERNFYAAYQRVRAKNSGGGIDQVSVEQFARQYQSNLHKLRREIMQGLYNPDPVKASFMPKFNDKGEFRQLGLPTVRDKIVQTALLQVVEPLAEKLFLDTSYGYRQHKGHRKAIGRVEDYLFRGKHWIVRQDIDNFFDSLDHERLLNLFNRLLNNEQPLVNIVALWCRTGIVARSGKWHNVETGVRQGQVISPLLANLYLHDLDVFAESNGWGWVRYADDFLIMVPDEPSALQADKSVRQYLKQELYLELNENAEAVSSLEKGFSFLGVHFHRDERKIAVKKINKMQNQISWLLSSKNTAAPEKILADLEKITTGWLRYYGFFNPVDQFQALEQIIAQKFTQLAHERITHNQWPAHPPTGLYLPCLLPCAGDVVAEGQIRLRKLWPPEETVTVSQTIQKADKQVGKKRRQHLRQQVAEGELFVTSPGHFVGRSGERIVVRRQKTVVAEILGHRLTGLTVGERGIALSTDVIGFCAEKGISVYLTDSFGKITAMVSRPDASNADLVEKQLINQDAPKGLTLARMFITGKVKNQLALLKSFSKYRQRKNNAYRHALLYKQDELEGLIKKIQDLPLTSPHEFRAALLGLEGAFAAQYWALIAQLIPEHYLFHGREHHGAKDIVNVLLNYGYGILYSHILTAVTKAGLNTTIGFLHASQGKKPVLTFDLIEEFRAPVVDRTILGMLNRREVFGQEPSGALDKEARKKLAANITARLGNEVMHCGQKNTLKDILHAQPLVIRDILNGKGVYKPYRMRW